MFIDNMTILPESKHLEEMSVDDYDDQSKPRASTSCPILHDLYILGDANKDITQLWAMSSMDDYDYDSILSNYTMMDGRDSCWTDTAFGSIDMYSSSSASDDDECSPHDSFELPMLTVPVNENPWVNSDITDSQSTSTSYRTAVAVSNSPKTYEHLSEILSSQSLRCLNDSSCTNNHPGIKLDSQAAELQKLQTIYETTECDGKGHNALNRNMNIFKCLWSAFRMKRFKTISQSESTTSESTTHKEKSQVIIQSLSDDDFSIQTSLIVFDPRS